MSKWDGEWHRIQWPLYNKVESELNLLRGDVKYDVKLTIQEKIPFSIYDNLLHGLLCKLYVDCSNKIG